MTKPQRQALKALLCWVAGMGGWLGLGLWQYAIGMHPVVAGVIGAAWVTLWLVLAIRSIR